MERLVILAIVLAGCAAESTPEPEERSVAAEIHNWCRADGFFLPPAAPTSPATTLHPLRLDHQLHDLKVAVELSWELPDRPLASAMVFLLDPSGVESDRAMIGYTGPANATLQAPQVIAGEWTLRFETQGGAARLDYQVTATYEDQEGDECPKQA